MRSRRAVLAAALVIITGTGLAAPAAPRALAENNGIAVSAPLMGWSINLDDFWYQCPGSQGPDVDQYGRWVTDPAKFPPAARSTASRPSRTTCTAWA